MDRPIYPALLAMTLMIAVSTVPVNANKDGDKGHGKDKGGAKVEHRSDARFDGGKGKVKAHNKVEVRQQVRGGFDNDNSGRGHGSSDDFKEARKDMNEARKDTIKEFKADMKDAREAVKERRNDLREEARDFRKDEFKEAKRDFKEFKDDLRDDNLRLNLDNDFRRAVFVAGVPHNSPDFVLIRVTPDNEARLSRLFLDNRDEDVRWIDRLFRHRFDVGSVIEDDDFGDIRLLPLSYNAELGLPMNDSYRVGVVDDQLVLIDMDRHLVMDMLRFDNDGRLVATDLNIPNERLFFYRLDNDDDAALRAYVLAHPELFTREISLGERLRRNALLPLGFGDVVIGRTVPVFADPVYLSPPVLADLNLPATDLKLALVGDDLALIDSDTNLVLDVVRDVV